MSPVADFVHMQRAFGAELRESNGLCFAADYGNPENELRTARDGTVIIWQPWRAYLHVTGDERLIFLQRLLTANIQGLKSGDSTHGLLLDKRGKVQASLDLWIEETAVLIGSDTSVIASVAKELGRYVLRSAVQINVAPLVSLAFVGPAHELVARELELELSTKLAHPARGRGLRTERLPGGFEIALAEPQANELWHAVSGLGDASVRSAGRSVSEVLRVEAGVPCHGAELTGNELPQEARLESAVDFEKGCYLGQETVARIYYRGHVNRLLCGLRFESVVAPGAKLFSGGRNAGEITSAVVSDCHGPIGLGYLHRELTDPGVKVRVDDDSTALVAPLPFAGDSRLGAATQNA